MPTKVISRITGLRLDYKLVEGHSSVCRICNVRKTDRPLVQVEVHQIITSGGTTLRRTAFYCFECYNFVYTQRKKMEIPVPSFLGLVYDVPSSEESGVVSSEKLFNILGSCCPADALQQYKKSLSGASK